MSDFKERLLDLLYDHNLTYQELAKTSKISRSNLQFWIEYGINPKPKSIIELAKHFSCPIDYFLGRTDKTKIKFSNAPIKFSERLQSLIDEKEITPYRLCKDLYINTDRTTVWLNKGTLPSYEHLLLLVNYFNCSADYLLGLSSDKII